MVGASVHSAVAGAPPPWQASFKFHFSFDAVLVDIQRRDPHAVLILIQCVGKLAQLHRQARAIASKWVYPIYHQTPPMAPIWGKTHLTTYSGWLGLIEKMGTSFLHPILSLDSCFEAPKAPNGRPGQVIGQNSQI